MRKHAWALALPILLGGAVFWAREVAWNRMEEEFRRAFISETVEWTSRPSVALIQNGWGRPYPKFLGQWKDKELEDALTDVHLMHSPLKGSSEFEPAYYSILYGSEMSSYYGIFIDVGKDEGTFRFSLPQYDKWRGLELTPASCRALKRRILALQNPTGK